MLSDVMTSVIENVPLNSSIVEEFYYYINEIIHFVWETIGFNSNFTVNERASTNFVVDAYDNIVKWLDFNEFQEKLFGTFLLMLCANIFLIFISWKVFGKKISEKFMKPVTSKAIEDLKKSVSLLKLPREHSPRV